MAPGVWTNLGSILKHPTFYNFFQRCCYGRFVSQINMTFLPRSFTNHLKHIRCLSYLDFQTFPHQ
jgi:hypothetical protein